MDLLLILISITVLSNCTYAMIAPFFPIEAERKGVSIPMIGCIIGIYSVAVIINSTIVGKVMLYVGRSNITIIGLLVMGTTMIGFALSYYIEDRTTFIVVTLFIRFFQGLASSAIQVSAYSIVTLEYPDKMATVIGYIEASIGAGLTLGPLLGSVMFYFGGYTAPFFAFGLFFYFIVFVGRSKINQLENTSSFRKHTEGIDNNEKHEKFIEDLPKQKRSNEAFKDFVDNGSSVSESDKKDPPEGKDVFSKVPILKLLTYKQFVFAMVSGTFGYFIGSFVEPILALRLKNTYHFRDSIVSLFFVIHFMGYMVFSPLVQYIPHRFEKRLVMMFGLVLSFITLMFYGPSKMLNLPEDWHLMLIGIILVGGSIAL